MEGGIELDDIQVVEVTGKAHRDRQRKSRRGGCHWNPSLRATTILIFVCIGIVYVIGVAIGNILMFNSLEYLDQGSSNTSINRLTMLIEDDMVKLKQMVRDYAFKPDAVSCSEYLNTTNSPDELDSRPEYVTPLRTFVLNFLNNTSRLNETGGKVLDQYGNAIVDFGTSSEVNFWAFLNNDFKLTWSVYHPKPADSPLRCGIQRQYPPPVFNSETFRNIVKDSGKPLSGWLRILTPDENVFEPMIISMEPIQVDVATKDLDNYTELPPGILHGYFIAGRSLLPRMGGYSDDVPTCITIQNGKNDAAKWDDIDLEMFAKVKKGTFGVNKSYGGVPVFTKRENATLAKSADRRCPAIPLFNATSSLMTGYIDLCGLDPEKYGNSSCVYMRLDRPMSMVEQGTLPVVSLSLEIIGMMILLCIIFVIFLDCVVLRRIVNLSNVIKKQTRGHAKALKDDDDTTATASVHEDVVAEKKGKSGKSSKGKSSKSSGTGTSEGSHTTNSSDGGAGPAEHHGTGRDEIGNLKRAMEQNALGLRKRLEAVNDSIKIEQQKTIRHKQAMQLLNLWCGRKDYFPGLRPNAMQLRYEPTRNLDDLLSNPLAIEYLKSHCESDRTLENLWFILDVSWLEELETAEDNEQDPEKRNQIHEVATGAAKTILQRYIAVNAPQQINISAGTYKKLREKGEHYARHMFEDAVSEVKLMLNTDILPRFQKSAAYSAMSETLFIDSSGDGDESEFSDETVSTAGSILTDEAEEGEGGVAHVFAHTFKNLHTAFEIGHDENSSNYSASSSHATASGAVVGTKAKGPEKNTVHTSSKDGSTVTGDNNESDEESEKEPEPPKLKDDEKKAKDGKKGSDESTGSSDSSNHSISSDSMSSSSTSTAASEDSD